MVKLSSPYKGDIQKYYEIHAINIDKAIGLHILMDSQPHMGGGVV